MFKIEYEPSAGRYLMLLPAEMKEITIDVVGRNENALYSIPERITLMPNYHRVYRLGDWVVEVLNATLVICRILHSSAENKRFELRFGDNLNLYYQVQEIDTRRIPAKDERENEIEVSLKEGVSGIILSDAVYLDAEEESEIKELEFLDDGLAGNSMPSGRDTRALEEIDELTKRLEEKESEIERLKEENAALTAAGLTADLEALQQKKTDLESEIAFRQAQKEMLQAEIAASEEEEEQLRLSVEEARARQGRIRLTVNELRRELETYERMQVEAHANSQLVQIDTEATMTALQEQTEMLLYTQDAALLLNQVDLADQLKSVGKTLEEAQKTLTGIIRLREAADEQIKASLRRKPSKGDL